MWCVLMLVLLQGSTCLSTDMDPQLEPPISIMPATDDSACNVECPKETKAHMKQYNQCLLRLNRASSRYRRISDAQFKSMVDSAPSDCAEDDICHDTVSALTRLDTCKQDEMVMLDMKERKTGSKRHKRDIATHVHLRPTISGWLTKTPIKYSIDTAISSTDKDLIKSVLDYYNTHSCLSFTEMDPSEPYDGIIFVSDNTGCWSRLGNVGGKQPINLQAPSCMVFTIIAHEMGHALGLIHEQSRSDRDAYVNILKDKIVPVALNNFQTDRHSLLLSLYDYSSMMQYPISSFPITAGVQTVVPKNPKFTNMIGQRSEPSFFDFSAINKLYCKDTCSSSSVNCQHGGYPNPGDCSKCLCPPAFRGPDPECRDVVTLDTNKCGTDAQMRSLSVATSMTKISKGNFLSLSSRSEQFSCVWSVEAPDGYVILINAVKFSLVHTSGDNCISQWVELIDPKKPYEVVPRYCSVIGPTNVIMESNRLVILLMVYKTNIANPITIQGFELDVSMIQDACGSVSCASNAECFNKPNGGHSCICRAGYSGDGTTSCSDIQDCATSPSPCGNNEKCTDIPGSYTCECMDNFCGQVGGCLPCTDAQFNEDMTNYHNHIRRQLNASDMVELKHSQAISDAVKEANAACNVVTSPVMNFRVWRVPKILAGSAQTLETVGNLTTELQGIYEAGCPSTLCTGYNYMVLNSFLEVGCAAVFCYSSTPIYKHFIADSMDKTLIVLTCGYAPILDTAEPFFTPGEACSKCPEYRSACREDLCVEAPTTTTTSTTKATTTDPSTISTIPTTTSATTTTTTTTTTTKPPTPSEELRLLLNYAILSTISTGFKNTLSDFIVGLIRTTCTKENDKCCSEGQFSDIMVVYQSHLLVFRQGYIFLFRFTISATCTTIGSKSSVDSGTEPLSGMRAAKAGTIDLQTLAKTLIEANEVKFNAVVDAYCASTGTTECKNVTLYSVAVGKTNEVIPTVRPPGSSDSDNIIIIAGVLGVLFMLGVIGGITFLLIRRNRSFDQKMPFGYQDPRRVYPYADYMQTSPQFYQRPLGPMNMRMAPNIFQPMVMPTARPMIRPMPIRPNFRPYYPKYY